MKRYTMIVLAVWAGSICTTALAKVRVHHIFGPNMVLQRGKAVQLPPTQQPEKQPDEGKDIVVSVQWLKKGAGFGHKIYMGQDQVNEERLRTRLLDELRKDPSKSIYLKGDKRLNYGAVRQVMEICHEAGFQQVKLATEELQAEKKG